MKNKKKLMQKKVSLRWPETVKCIYLHVARGQSLTYTRIVVHHTKYSIAASLHVVVRTDATKHRRKSELGPRLVAQVPGKK